MRMWEPTATDAPASQFSKVGGQVPAGNVTANEAVEAFCALEWPRRARGVIDCSRTIWLFSFSKSDAVAVIEAI